MISPPSNNVLAPFVLDAAREKIAKLSDRNVLVLAGPGAGKTHLLVAHACWLAQATAGRSVMLTYSRKAAAELKRRADTALPEETRQLVVASTVHAFAFDIVRTHGHRMGLPANIEVVDGKELQELADEVARRTGEPPMPDFATRLEKFQRLGGDLEAPTVPSLVNLVVKEMHSRGRLGWDSLVRLATTLLSSDEQIRDSVRHHDRNILLDEAQDCDAAQLALIEQVVGPPPGQGHLFVVMDPDQSLYAFRQANAELARAWALRYAGEEEELTENFRCEPRIQALASFVIQKPTLNVRGPGRATCRTFADRQMEADWLAQAIEVIMRGGVSPQRLAILARRRSRLDVVMSTLTTRIQVRQDPREQWTPPEERILSTVAFLRDWRDGSTSPDVVATFLIDVLGRSEEEVRSLELEALRARKHPGDLLTDQWWRDLNDWLAERRSPEQIIEQIAPHAGARPDDLRALRELAQQARSLTDVLQVARSGPGQTQSAHATGVLVTTFHGAKGLEFDTVFIVGCEEGTIPDFRARSENELRDERRGLYVAITRAGKEVVLTYVTTDRGHTQRPSRFLPSAGADTWSES